MAFDHDGGCGEAQRIARLLSEEDRDLRLIQLAGDPSQIPRQRLRRRLWVEDAHEPQVEPHVVQPALRCHRTCSGRSNQAQGPRPRLREGKRNNQSEAETDESTATSDPVTSEPRSRSGRIPCNQAGKSLCYVALW